MHDRAVFLLRNGLTSPQFNFPFWKLLWSWNIAATKVTKQRKRSQTTLKKQSEAVINITTYRAKDGATEGQATTLTGFLATNRFRGGKERCENDRQKGRKSGMKQGSHFWNFFFLILTTWGEPTSSTPPSPHTAGEKTHFRQLTSCLSAQAIWSKSSWCTKESKMVYCNMRNNHSKEQPNVT